ncbi:MAG TPA: hypothetical protein VIN09_04660 [Chloroflexota bacterium]
MEAHPLRVNPTVLLGTFQQAMDLLLPPEGVEGGYSQEARRLATRLRRVPPELWSEALGVWPEADFFTSAIVKKLVAGQSAEAGRRLAQGLVTRDSYESLLYRSVKDAAFFAAFALGYAYGREASKTR